MAGNYRALKAALSAEDLVGLSDAEATDKLNNDMIPQPKSAILVADLLKLARERGLVPRIRQFSGTVPNLPPPAGVPDGAKLAALAAVDLFESPNRSLDLESPEVTTILDALEQSTLLTTYNAADGSVLVPGNVNRTAILALSDRGISRSISIVGWDLPVTEADITRARELEVNSG